MIRLDLIDQKLIIIGFNSKIYLIWTVLCKNELTKNISNNFEN